MSKESGLGLVSFNEFVTYVKEEIGRIKGSDYEVRINHIIKNNSIELDGLVILRKGESISPNIYLNSYYDNYTKGVTMTSIIEEVIAVYENSKNDDFSQPFEYYDFESMKPSIIYRIINLEKNKSLLNTIPYLSFLDLAITFHCLVRSSGEGIGTIRITYDLLKCWNANLEEIANLAKNNTPKLFPAIIRTMEEVIRDILNNKDSSALDENNIQDSWENTEGFQLSDDKYQASMYVLSNVKGINGASCLLYPEAIKVLANKLNTDFYILPSSIHELILIPIMNNMKVSDLNSMVIDVNDTQVPSEDILSDHVYIYRRIDDAISLQN